MDISIPTVISWLIVGALAGALVGGVMKGRKGGYGFWKNFGIGLIGAVIGGFLVRLLKLDFGLGEIKVTAQDLVAAVLGAFLFLGILWFVNRRKAAKTPGG